MAYAPALDLTTLFEVIFKAQKYFWVGSSNQVLSSMGWGAQRGHSARCTPFT